MQKKKTMMEVANKKFLIIFQLTPKFLMDKIKEKRQHFIRQ